MIGAPEIIILLFVVFLLLGPKRIVNIFQSLGRGVQDFTNEFGTDKKDKMIGGEEDPEDDSSKRPHDSR